MEGRDFCEAHRSIPDPDIAEGKGRIPYIYRLAALVLLLMFLFNAYQTFRQWLER